MTPAGLYCVRMMVMQTLLFCMEFIVMEDVPGLIRSQRFTRESVFTWNGLLRLWRPTVRFENLMEKSDLNIQLKSQYCLYYI